MTAKRDYYEILGVNKTASHQEIEQAYRKLAIQFHPDRVAPDKKEEARGKFKELSEAYAVLSDAEKKRQYDQFGHAGIDGRYASEDIFRGADFGSIFEDLGFGGGVFDNLFGGIFGGGRRRRSGGTMHGADLEYRLDITLEEAYYGTEKEIQFYTTVTCPTCNGSGARPGTGKKTCPQCRGTGQQTSAVGGFFTFSQTCSRCYGAGQIIEKPCVECNGRGKVKKSSKIKIKIPRGVDTGTSVRVRGKGEAGELGGPSGDLYVVTMVAEHERYVRQRDDLYTELNINFPVACLGGEVSIPTLDSKVKMKIPSGTPANKTFRMKGKGMPNVHTNRFGDLYVRVNIDVPTRLSGKQKDLLKEFKQTL